MFTTTTTTVRTLEPTKLTNGSTSRARGAVQNQLIDQSVKRAVDEQLAQKGLAMVDKDADLHVGYHAINREEKGINLSAFGDGGGPWRWGGSWGGFNSGTVPGDFDVAQISWRADYDPFFYRQLSRRARRIYLFRDEYIFDVEKAVVVETPQLGHATYVFAKPRNMDSFLALYTKITKDDIRRNRNNAAERLGFLGRVIHGTNPRVWLREVRQRVGEGIDFEVAIGV